MSEAVIDLKTKADTSGISETNQAFIGLTKEEQRAEAQNLRLAQSYARLDAAMKQPAQGAARLRDALANATFVDQRQAVGALTQITNLEKQAEAQALKLAKAQATLSRGGIQEVTKSTTSLSSAFGSLSSTVGTFGIALGAAQIGRFAIDAGKSALSLRETENALRAVSGNALVYAEALRTARQQQVLFGGSLEENIQGIQGLVITSRDTGANLKALVDLSQRLAIKSPEQGAGGSRIAIAEAFSEGNITSLSRRFEIPKDKIRELSNEALPAAQKIKILSDYLDSIGISSAAVAGKVDPTARSFRELGASAENAKISIGGLLADALKPTADSATNILSIFDGTAQGFERAGVGAANLFRTMQFLPPIQTEATTSTQELKKANDDGASGLQRFASVILSTVPVIRLQATAFDEDRVAVGRAQIASEQFSQAIRLEGAAKATTAAQTEQLTRFQAQLTADSANAANGLLGAGDQALILAQKYGIAVNVARELISQQRLIALEGLGTEARSERQGAAGNNDTRTALRELADSRASSERDRVNRTGTTAAKIAQAHRDAADAAKQYGATSTQAYDAQTKVIELQQQAAAEALRSGKSHTSELNKQLGLQEGIYDSINKQKDALLDIEELTIRDRQQDRKDAAERKTALAILGSANASADLKARAADALALIDVQDRQRAQAIAEKQATAGGAIVNGRVLQSQVGGGGSLPPAGAVASAGAIAPAGGGASPSAPGSATFIFNVDGKKVGEYIIPDIIGKIYAGVQQALTAEGM